MEATSLIVQLLALLLTIFTFMHVLTNAFVVNLIAANDIEKNSMRMKKGCINKILNGNILVIILVTFQLSYILHWS